MSTETTSEFDLSQIGVETDPVTFGVERARLIAYAEATNDTIPQHADGTYAPPVFAVVAAFEAAATAAVKAAPPEVLMRVVHGEQDFFFHKPIEPGQTLTTKARIIGITPKSSGVTIAVRADTVDKDGAAVVDQYMTSFFRGAQTPTGAGDEAPGHAFPEDVREQPPAATVTQRFDEDQTFRYAPAAGDPMPIHTDDALAKAMGLPGIIIHGLCTMAFTSRAVIETACPSDPTRLKRLAVRFSKPCLPGQEITTSIWRAPSGVLVYETTNDAGDVVIKDGLAEIA